MRLGGSSTSHHPNARRAIKIGEAEKKSENKRSLAFPIFSDPINTPNRRSRAWVRRGEWCGQARHVAAMAVARGCPYQSRRHHTISTTCGCGDAAVLYVPARRIPRADVRMITRPAGDRRSARDLGGAHGSTSRPPAPRPRTAAHRRSPRLEAPFDLTRRIGGEEE